MRFRPIVAVVIATMLLGLHSNPASVLAGGGDPTPKMSTITVSRITDHAFTISWFSSASETGRVLWGMTSGGLTNVAEDNRGVDTVSQIHYVTIAPLAAPLTQYFYQVVSGGSNLGDEGSVTTANSDTAIPGPPDYFAGRVMDSDGREVQAVIFYYLKDSNERGSPGDSALFSVLTWWSDASFVVEFASVRTTDGDGFFDYDKSDLIVINVETPDGRVWSDTIAVAMARGDNNIIDIRLNESVIQTPIPKQDQVPTPTRISIPTVMHGIIYSGW